MTAVSRVIFVCEKCGSDMVKEVKKDDGTFYYECFDYDFEKEKRVCFHKSKRIKRLYRSYKSREWISSQAMSNLRKKSRAHDYFSSQY